MKRKDIIIELENRMETVKGDIKSYPTGCYDKEYGRLLGRLTEIGYSIKLLKEKEEC